MKSGKEELPVPEKTIELGRKAYYIVSVLLVASCLLVVWQYKNFFAKEGLAENLIVKTQVVGAAVDAPSFAFTGKLRGRYEIPLSFSASGRVSEIAVAAGKSVKSGDVLMRLAKIEAPAAAPIANYAGGEAGQAELQKAEADLKRYEALYNQGAISRVMYERYQAAYAAAQAGAQRVSGATPSSPAAPVGVLRSDYGGVVIGVEVKEGDMVNAGQMVLLLAKDGAKEVEFNVPESQFGDFSKMETIKVKLSELPEVELRGKIRDSAVVSAAEGAFVKVRLTLLDPPPEAMYGMTALVSAGGPGALRPDVVVPLNAVLQKEAAPAIWVVSEHRAVLRSVKLRSQDDEHVKIIDGLAPGEVIVVSGVQTLQEGKWVE